MSIISQFICCVIASFLVWFICGMILLSPQFGILGTDLFGPANTPISTIVITALFIGLAQGSLTAILILWQKSNTIFGYCVSSFIATEIFLFAAMLVHIVLFIKNNQIILNTSNLFQGGIFFVFWYLVLSLIFSMPSILIGFASEKVLGIAESKMLF
jgi:hypothetical protein